MHYSAIEWEKTLCANKWHEQKQMKNVKIKMSMRGFK